MRSVSAFTAGVVLLLASAPAPVGAWGMDVHRYLTRRAVDALPPELGPFFASHREFVGEHSVDPDLWRDVGLMSERGNEAPNHFLDIDGLDDPPPFRGVPRDWDAYVAKYGADRANRAGRLPWRAEDIYTRLVTAFREVGQGRPVYAPDKARYLVAVLSHYIEDAHQPFHAVMNYDGQLTGQRGIHARFETTLILRNLDRFTLQPVRVRTVPNIRDFMFETLIESQSLVEPILAADRRARAGRDDYDDAYYDLFREGAGDIAVRRMSSSVSAVVSVVVAAWTEAGKPALPAGVGRPPVLFVP